MMRKRITKTAVGMAKYTELVRMVALVMMVVIVSMIPTKKRHL